VRISVYAECANERVARQPGARLACSGGAVQRRQSVTVDCIRNVSRAAAAREQQIHNSIVTTSSSGSMKGVPEARAS